MDERKLRLYKFLLDMGRITLDEIPEPYYSELSHEPEPMVDPDTSTEPTPTE